MKQTKVLCWRVKHAHYDDICLGSIIDISSVLRAPTYFYPLSLPLLAAEAIFGADIVAQVTEEPGRATLTMQIHPTDD